MSDNKELSNSELAKILNQKQQAALEIRELDKRIEKLQKNQ